MVRDVLKNAFSLPMSQAREHTGHTFTLPVICPDARHRCRRKALARRGACGEHRTRLLARYGPGLVIVHGGFPCIDQSFAIACRELGETAELCLADFSHLGDYRFQNRELLRRGAGLRLILHRSFAGRGEQRPGAAGDRGSGAALADRQRGGEAKAIGGRVSQRCRTLRPCSTRNDRPGLSQEFKPRRLSQENSRATVAILAT